MPDEIALFLKIDVAFDGEAGFPGVSDACSAEASEPSAGGFLVSALLAVSDGCRQKGLTVRPRDRIVSDGEGLGGILVEIISVILDKVPGPAVAERRERILRQSSRFIILRVFRLGNVDAVRIDLLLLGEDIQAEVFAV